MTPYVESAFVAALDMKKNGVDPKTIRRTLLNQWIGLRPAEADEVIAATRQRYCPFCARPVSGTTHRCTES